VNGVPPLRTPTNGHRTVLILRGEDGNKGGVVNFYAKLSRSYAESKYNAVHFRVGRIQRLGLFNILPLRLCDLFLNYVRFVRTIRRISPAIVHLNPSLARKAVWRDAAYVYLARTFGHDVKILTHVRGWAGALGCRLRERSLFNYAAKYLFMSSDHVIVLASRFREQLLSAFPISPDRISVVPTVADVPLLCDLVPDRQMEQNCVRVLFLSRLVREKGIYELAKSIDAVVRQNVDTRVRFTFAGDGKDRRGLEREIDRNEVREYTEFVGYVRGDDKERLLSTCDIFVFPSYHDEGCPNAVLEAMAAGLPIVSTPVGALRDIVVDGANGLIIKERSTDDIVRALNMLIRSPQMRRRMAANNREKALAEFDPRVIFARLESCYDGLLSRR